MWEMAGLRVEMGYTHVVGTQLQTYYAAGCMHGIRDVLDLCLGMTGGWIRVKGLLSVFHASGHL